MHLNLLSGIVHNSGISGKSECFDHKVLGYTALTLYK